MGRSASILFILMSILATSASAKAELAWSIDDIAKTGDLHCYRTKAPCDEELRSTLQKFENSRLKSALETLLKDPNGKILHSSANDSPIEASQRIFGNRVGLQLLYIFVRYQVNASHLQAKDTSPWTTEELDDVILGLSDLPKHLIPLPINRYTKRKGFVSIMRHKRGDPLYDDEDAPTYADAGINFYDAWSELPTHFARRNRVLHEIGHSLQNLIRSVNEKNWENLSQRNKKQASFVTRYAQTNSYEDLAESFITYRYVPQWLKKRNPEKYEYFREVYFDGVEYTSEEDCKKSDQSIVKEYVASMAKAFSEKRFTLTAPTACDEKFIQNLSAKEHSDCIATTFAKEFRESFKLSSIQFMEDMTDVRIADGTGGIADPEMNVDLKNNLGAAARRAIRLALVKDFARFKGAEASSCDVFSTKFQDWRAAEGRSAGKNASSASYAYKSIFNKACEKGIASRSKYTQFFETFKGQGNLTQAEFQLGLRQVLGN